ncbi:hypothetical protein ACERK3_15680 [Phycisphaerales bacterium AB-hyl4]|uniref:Halocarboxylic acid dehydrogenase DehI n=1 Tax=Natronomicrosphaera hydrolytica TaxID=3242702 RepID=A0ABV4UA81_9BACT
MRKLFVAGLSSLLADLGKVPADTPATGIQMFDELSRDQQLMLLWQVAEPLLVEACPAPEPTIHLDLTVAAIYRHALDRTLQEVHGRVVSRTWRQIVLDVQRALDLIRCVEMDTRDEGKWESVVEIARDRLVRTELAWEHLDRMLDDPGLARRAREGWDLPRDYFCAVAPDPTPQEASAAKERLAKFTDSGLASESPAAEPRELLIAASLRNLVDLPEDEPLYALYRRGDPQAVGVFWSKPDAYKAGMHFDKPAVVKKIRGGVRQRRQDHGAATDKTGD